MAKDSPRVSRFSAIAGGAIGALAVIAPVNATAQETAPAVMTHEEELEQLGQATRQAIEYARAHGVAIVLHIGDDVRNHEHPEGLLAWLEQQFRERFAAEGIDVGIFSRTNLNSAATTLEYQVGDHVFIAPGDDDPFLGLQTAMDLIPLVAEQGRIALQLAAAAADVPALNRSGG